MRLLSKTVIAAALPTLAAFTFAVPASAAAHSQRPSLRVPHFPANVRTAPLRANATFGTRANTYVSTKGSDSGTCPKSAPCATITYAESQTAIAGTIHVAAGTYNQSADLTQPLHLEGSPGGKVIIDGKNVDYTAHGYYGVLGIDNTSGTAGTIAISNLTVTRPHITLAESNEDQAPVDIANYDRQAGDTVDVTHVTLGPAQHEATFSGIGYYSLNSQSANNVTDDSAHGMFQAYFAEGSDPKATTFTHDTASGLVGDEYQGTFYPAVGLFALSDTSGALHINARNDSFTKYDGYGIAGSAGFSLGNCSANVCTGGLTIKANDNFFQLTAAPKGSGAAAISLDASQNDSLTAILDHSSGTVAKPDATVSMQDDGGTMQVIDSHNTIDVTK